MYLTYAEYQALGGTLDAASYMLYEFKARAEIDWVTFDRLKNDAEYPEAVKMCMFVIIGELQKMDAYTATVGADNSNSESGAVSSMSNDGVSVSYNTLNANDGVLQAKTVINDAINKYLQGVTNELGRRVLYRGLYPDE